MVLIIYLCFSLPNPVWNMNASAYIADVVCLLPHQMETFSSSYFTHTAGFISLDPLASPFSPHKKTTMFDLALPYHFTNRFLLCFSSCCFITTAATALLLPARSLCNASGERYTHSHASTLENCCSCCFPTR